MNQEQRWIRAILRRGSTEAADKLIRAYYDGLYYFIYRQVGDRDDALDLTQESFMAALQALPSYDEKKAGFRTWLYRIATNKVIDARRKPTRITLPLDADELNDSPTLHTDSDFAAEIADRQLLSEIEQWVCSLDPLLQEIYRLRLYGGHSFPDIAGITGQPEAKIKSSYYRLMERLRKEFSDES